MQLSFGASAGFVLLPILSSTLEGSPRPMTGFPCSWDSMTTWRCQFGLGQCVYQLVGCSHLSCRQCLPAAGNASLQAMPPCRQCLPAGNASLQAMPPCSRQCLPAGNASLQAMPPCRQCLPAAGNASLQAMPPCTVARIMCMTWCGRIARSTCNVYGFMYALTMQNSAFAVNWM